MTSKRRGTKDSFRVAKVVGSDKSRFITLHGTHQEASKSMTTPFPSIFACSKAKASSSFQVLALSLDLRNDEGIELLRLVLSDLSDLSD